MASGIGSEVAGSSALQAARATTAARTATERMGFIEYVSQQDDTGRRPRTMRSSHPQKLTPDLSQICDTLCRRAPGVRE
jgi:hypothetical protein